MQHIVIDTNIVLLDANNIVNVADSNTTVYIPEVVVNEVDAKKTSSDPELKYQAREFGRTISKAEPKGISSSTYYTKYKCLYKGVYIAIVTPFEYKISHDTDQSIVNDRKIIYTAKLIQNSLGSDSVCTFMSNDVMCRIYAQTENLATRDYKLVDKVDFEFNKNLIVDQQTFEKIHNKHIFIVDPTYKPENYNYKFYSESTSQVKLATISNGLIDVIGRKTESDIRRQDINPINAEQLFLSKAILDHTNDIVISESMAGSGKTAVAISNGIQLVKKGYYDTIIYVRASVDDVEQAEEVGFLPGLEDKFAIYLHPLDDTLDFIARNKLKSSKLKDVQLEERIAEEVQSIKSTCNIQTLTGLGMRGRTFNNAYIIIDEAQNQSASSLQKMVTRVGKNCKLIVTGSLRQIDNKFISKYTSGLSTLMKAATKHYDEVSMHAVTLHKVVRSPIAEFAEKLFSDKDRS